jgi:hypothetical protein
MDIQRVYSKRVVARDVHNQGYPAFTTAKYLWATWKAHAVMGKYLHHQFYEHPSISAVLARHLANNFLKPDDTQGTKIKSLESQIKVLERAQKALQSKYDSLQMDWEKADKYTKKKTGGAPQQLGVGKPFINHPSFAHLYHGCPPGRTHAYPLHCYQ